MRKLKRRDREPRCGWCYDVEQTNFRCRAGSWDNLVRAVRLHLKANDIPRPDNLEELIEDQMCAKIPDTFWTSDCGETNPLSWSDGEMMQRIRQMIRDINRNKTPGYIASEAVAKKRMHTCIGCPMNVNPFGCFPCSAHYKRVAGWRFGAFNKPPKAAGSDTYAYVCWGSGLLILLLIYATSESILPVSRKILFDKLPEHCWLKEIRPEEKSDG